jgi:hypothetical protein
MTPPVLRRLRHTRVRPEVTAASDVPPGSRPGHRLEIVAGGEVVPRGRVGTEPASSAEAAARGTDQIERQLLRLEERLLAEVTGDPAAERDMRRCLALARAHFAEATVRQYLPILVERDVRGRLRDRTSVTRGLGRRDTSTTC